MMNRQTSAGDQTKFDGLKFTSEFASLAQDSEFGALFILNLHDAITLFLAARIFSCVHVDHKCIESSLEFFCLHNLHVWSMLRFLR